MIYFLVASLALRLIGFCTSSIWLDEALTLWVARQPFAQSPINLWMWIERLFTANVTTLRLPALLCGMAALYVAWRIMDRLAFTQPQRIIACVALAALPGMIWTAQDARYYALMQLLTLACLYFAIEERPLGLAACIGLLAFTHPTGPVYAAVAILPVLLSRNRKILYAGLGLLPWLVFIYIWRSNGSALSTIDQAGEFWLKHPDWLNGPGAAVFVGTIFAPIGTFLVAMLLINAVWNAGSRNVLILLAAVIGPVVGLCLGSLVVGPVLFYRTLIPVLPMFCLLVGYTVGDDDFSWKPAWIAPGILSIVLLVSLVNYNPDHRGGGIDYAAYVIRENWQEGDVIVYNAGMVALPFDYYLQRGGQVLYLEDGNFTPRGWPENAPEFEVVSGLPEQGRIWLVWAYDPLIPIHPPETLPVPVALSEGSWQIAPWRVFLIEK